MLSISIQPQSAEFPWQQFTASWQRKSPWWRAEHPDFLSASYSDSLYLHGYKTIPSPLYFSGQDHAPNSSPSRAESAHTQTHIGWNSNTKTHGYTYRLQKQSLHIYICIYARIQRYSRAVEKVFKHTNIGETAPRAHPNLSIQESLCARKHVWLMGWLAGGG